VEIDKDIVSLFLQHHPHMQKFIDGDKPFYCRVGLKYYPTLIHHVISQDCDTETAISISNRLLQATGKITPRRVNKLSDWELVDAVKTQEKANLIRQITQDVISKKLRLKQLAKCDTQTIIKTLNYPGLTLSSLKQYALFGCFKQDVFCSEDPDFIDGLKMYLNKQDITKQDIINIEKEYKTQLTLFSLCMWRIKNERK